MRLAWLTDIHLNFIELDQREAFARAVAETGADGVVITGDIAEAPSVEELLGELAAIVARPVWFVLGNHDYYRSSIAGVRERMRGLTARQGLLRWLPALGVVGLGDGVAMVGHDGWGDGRIGDFMASRVDLSDYHHIDELTIRPRRLLRDRLHALGDEAAAYLAGAVAQALEHARHVVVATHVPPFREACWHEGRISDEDWLPHFTCGAVGEALRAAMAARPDARMTVLCGHTHGSGTADILPNLRVLTGGAEYGAPVIQQVLEV